MELLRLLSQTIDPNLSRISGINSIISWAFNLNYLLLSTPRQTNR